MTILLEGLCFAEGPRWLDGELWLSDMHAQEVLRVSPDGKKTSVVRLADDQPSGLGWLPSGELLIVSMTKRQLLRFDGHNLHVHADLSPVASGACNDMVVDATGRAYVGNFGFDLHNGAQPAPAEIVCVDPDGTCRVVDDDMNFPNGSVITDDGKTLIVAETMGQCLTAFDICDNGDLKNKRSWAKLPDRAVPDGICLDQEGGIWSASPSTSECVRQIEGGAVTHRIAVEQPAFACMIGDNNLYILTSTSSRPDECRVNKSGRVEVYDAPFPKGGLP